MKASTEIKLSRSGPYDEKIADCSSIAPTYNVPLRGSGTPPVTSLTIT
jgi:hypothetical protein